MAPKAKHARKAADAAGGGKRRAANGNAAPVTNAPPVKVQRTGCGCCGDPLKE